MISSFGIAALAAAGAWGGLVGLVVGFTAIGVGLIGTPGLIMLFGVDSVTAVGTMSVAGVFMMASGALSHLREQSIYFPIALRFLVTAVPASYASARYARALNELVPLQSVIGVVIVLSVILLFYRYVIMRPKPRVLNVTRAQLASAPFLGVVLGSIMGATSISGSLIVLSFIMLLRLPTPYAVGTTTVVTAGSLTIAAIAHLQSGNVDWAILLGLLPGVLIGAAVGARYANRLPRQVLRVGILIILMAAGVMVLLD